MNKARIKKECLSAVVRSLVLSDRFKTFSELMKQFIQDEKLLRTLCYRAITIAIVNEQSSFTSNFFEIHLDRYLSKIQLKKITYLLLWNSHLKLVIDLLSSPPYVSKKSENLLEKELKNKAIETGYDVVSQSVHPLNELKFSKFFFQKLFKATFETKKEDEGYLVFKKLSHQNKLRAAPYFTSSWLNYLAKEGKLDQIDAFLSNESIASLKTQEIKQFFQALAKHSNSDYFVQLLQHKAFEAHRPFYVNCFPSTEIPLSLYLQEQ